MSNSMPVPAPPRTVDPEAIRTEVEGLLTQLDLAGAFESVDSTDAELGPLPAQADILECAHDVLVRALATVDQA